MNLTSPTPTMEVMRKTLTRPATLLVAFLFAIALAACGEEAEGATAAVDAGTSTYLGSYSLMDEEFGTSVEVTVDDTTRTIVSNSLPDHETGEFPNDGNPNTITEQSLSFEFTTEPVFTGDASFAQTPGVAVNGVTFEPGTGESVTCDSGETYRIEALQDLYNLGLDFNNAHVQPEGQYHYHGISELLVDAYDSDEDLVHVGFAADGYLMYYSKSGAYSSSYELATEARSGTGCLATGPGNESFDIDGSSPDGTYGSDWEFVEGSGDLDSCNGTTVDGQYAYIVTDEYPYISRCLNGESAGGGPGGPPPDGGTGDGDANGQQTPGGAPDFSDAAAALGITEAELLDALGGPPPDVDAAAATLGISVEELTAVMPDPPAGQ